MREEIPIVYDAHNVESNFIMETFVNNPKYSKLERLVIPAYIRVIEKLYANILVIT